MANRHVLILAATLAFPAVAQADALSTLQGAWAEASLNCASLFKIDNGVVSFKSLDGFNSGAFIVENRRLKGQSTSCEIQRAREDGPDISLLLSCADSVMASAQDVHLKVLPDGTLSRSFAGFPDYQQSYKRCRDF
ncbi:MAG: hypothetical protein U1E62_20200 [Alsobacter sp.]